MILAFDKIMNAKTKWFLLASIAFCATALADDGLVIHFTVSKFTAEKKSTYSNGVLMRKTEVTSMIFPNQYEIRIDSKEISSGEVNLMMILKDVSKGMPVYAGSGASQMKIGESKQILLDSIPGAEVHYEIYVDTSYGQLPTSN